MALLVLLVLLLGPYFGVRLPGHGHSKPAAVSHPPAPAAEQRGKDETELRRTVTIRKDTAEEMPIGATGSAKKGGSSKLSDIEQLLK